MLHERVNYLNKDILYLVSKDIVEYDLREAGYNVIKHYKLLPQTTIDELSRLEKKDRTIEIGRIQGKDKNFRDSFKESFSDIRRRFMEDNGLEDNDVLAINNDAIHVLKRVPKTEFGNLLFVPTYYTSYYYFDNYRFYFNGKDIIIKGLSDDSLVEHKDYMLSVLKLYMMYNEKAMYRENKHMLKEFLHYYKTKALDKGYYRELNRDSGFRLEERLFGDAVILKEVETVEGIDIAYNFNTYILPMIQILA